MFSGMDEIDWKQLIHAYGNASDVPEDIRALVSSDRKSAKDALWRLFGNIYHQGTRYTATAAAVPFLTEAAIELEPERSADILSLLSAFAEPAADRIYDDQITVEAFKIAVLDQEKALSAEELEEYREFGCPPTVEVEVYEAVIAQIPQLLSELDVSHRDIQISLFELLSNFPKHSADAKELAQQAVFSREEDAALLVAAVECLSRLGRSVEVQRFESIFEELAEEHSSPFLKAHVALARKDGSEVGPNALLSALAHAEELYDMDRQSKRGKGWTVSHIAKALKPWASTEKERICEAIIRSLPAAKKFEADTSVLVDVLVYMLACPRPSKDFFSKKQSKDLTSLEKRALAQIVEFGSWKIGNKWFGNFTMQIASYGLPDRPAKLRRYLEIQVNPLTRWFKS